MIAQRFILATHVIIGSFGILHAVEKTNEKKAQLTLLSAPIGLPAYGYQGHRGVLRSLCAGFDQLRVDYSINPPEQLIGNTVIVLSHMTALLQAIGLKQRGIIQKLIVGPNVIERPQQLPKGISWDLVDAWLVPSHWVRLLFEADMPGIKGKVFCWYAGVDSHYWNTTQINNSRNVLIYHKRAPENLYQQIKKILSDKGWNPITVYYGNYRPEEFKQILSRVRYAIFLSKSETQGLALAEAWSMNVPTIVWDPRQKYDHGDWYQHISACPYLTKHTGIMWQKLQDFQTIIESIEQIIACNSPRHWIEQFMTDKQSTQRLLEIIRYL